KIGDEYFMLIINDDLSHEWWIYRVRSIQNRTVDNGYPPLIKPRIIRYVYAIAVFSWTWGKRSTKTGDYGWTDSISDDWRKKWRADEEPRDLFKTKKAAIKYEIATHDPENFDDPAEGARVLTKLQNMLKRS